MQVRRGLGANQPCRQARETHQAIEREQRRRKANCLPLTEAGREGEALKKSKTIELPFAQAEHQAKIGG